MPEVLFISYSHQDKMRVNSLRDQLDAFTTCWIDWNITPSTQWWGEIFTQIDQCFAFVPMLTENYLTSQICMMELHHALEMNKPILPFRLDECEYPSVISHIQYLDLQHDNPNSTDEIDLKANIDNILEEIRSRKRMGEFNPPVPLPDHPPFPSGKEIDRIRVQDCMETDLAYVWDDATLGDAALQIADNGRPPYLVIKNRSDETIAGWLTKGTLSARWPTILWQEIGLSAQDRHDMVKKAAAESIRPYMVSWGRLKCLTPDMTFQEALLLFCETHDFELQEFSIRSFPVKDNNNKAVGALAYWHLLAKAKELNLVPDVTVESCMLKINSSGFSFVDDKVTFGEIELSVDGGGWTSVAVTTKKSKQLVGMISREKIKLATDARYPQTYKLKVKPYLRRRVDLRTASPKDKVLTWLSLFIHDRQIDALPVMQDDKFVGLLRYIDLLELLRKSLENS